MKKLRFILGLFLLSVATGAAFAQSATVTATITTAWAGGSVVATFVPQGGGKPSPISTSGIINSAGAFSLNSAWQNTYSAYVPSVTTFNICIGSAPATCYSTTVQITSSSQDISSAFSGAPTPPSGGGTSVGINGGGALGTANINGTTPVAPGGSTNCVWQVSGANASCSVPTSSGVTSSIFYIASSCGGLSNCLTWVDDDSTDNCGSATTAFMSAINSYSGAGEAHVYIEGSGSGKAYKLTSCNLAFTGPSGTGGVAGSVNITSSATIDCAQTGGNCIQMGKTGCQTSSYLNFYGTGCHDITWRGGTFVGGVGLGTAVIEVEQGIAESIIDDVTFNNTGAGNATLGTCTNYSVQWDTFNGSPEFSRNKYYGTVAGQCFSKNADQTGGANTIIYTNNTILHTTAGNGGCGGILHQDSSTHSTIDNNTLYGFAVVLDLYQSAASSGDGGWIVTGNNLDTGACSVSGGQPASVQFGLPSNNANVGPVTFNNNQGYTSPQISQNAGSSASMQGWAITGNNTTVGSSFLIGGSSTSCATFNSVPCYLGANPGYPTTASGGGAYTGFTVLGATPYISSITTLGSSGPATVIGGALNVPQYGTWPPSASGPTFSPAAGAISSGTSVTTSCSGGSPFISTGSTAVAGASGIAVSSPETLYGSCQGSGYFSTGSAAYTISGGFSIANNGFIQNVPTSVTSAALSAFSNPLTPGSLIVVHQYSAAGTYTVPTDTAGNTYVDCGPGRILYASSANSMQCFYALNTHSTASNIVTIHSTATVYLTGLAFEVLGAASSSPIDGGAGVGYSSKANATGGTGSNDLSATSLTPAGNGDLIVEFIPSLLGSTVGTSPNVFTAINGTWTMASGYFLQATSAAITATATDSNNSDTFGAIVIAVKP